MGFAAMAQAQTAPAGSAPAPAPAAGAPMAGNVALPTKIAIIAIQQAIMATKEGSAAGAALNQKYEPKKADFEEASAKRHSSAVRPVEEGQRYHERRGQD